MNRFSHYRELVLAQINGVLAYVAAVSVYWIRNWTTTTAEALPSPLWIVATVTLATAVVFVCNARRTPQRLVFAAFRTAAHLLFGVAAPAVFLLLGILSAPHGMSQLSRLAPALCSLSASVIVGYALLRWVIAPREGAG